MPHIKIKLEWWGKTPKGAPVEETTVWPRAIDSEEEAADFRAAINENMDDQFNEQPRAVSWDGPFGVAPVWVIEKREPIHITKEQLDADD